jgi:hypothetical protein
MIRSLGTAATKALVSPVSRKIVLVRAIRPDEIRPVATLDRLLLQILLLFLI